MSDQHLVTEERVTVCFCEVCGGVTSTYKADAASIVKPSQRNLVSVKSVTKMRWCTNVSHNLSALDQLQEKNT